MTWLCVHSQGCGEQHDAPTDCCCCGGSGERLEGQHCECPLGSQLSELDSLYFYRAVRGLRAGDVMSERAIAWEEGDR
jgi:hypothetical protein